jgi:hypothetical protein
MRTFGVIALALTIGLTGCSSVHEPVLDGTVVRSQDQNVLLQLAYAKAHYKSPNKAAYGT